jgi:hypothetical protein
VAICIGGEVDVRRRLTMPLLGSCNLDDPEQRAFVEALLAGVLQPEKYVVRNKDA